MPRKLLLGKRKPLLTLGPPQQESRNPRLQPLARRLLDQLPSTRRACPTEPRR